MRFVADFPTGEQQVRARLFVRVCSRSRNGRKQGQDRWTDRQTGWMHSICVLLLAFDTYSAAWLHCPGLLTGSGRDPGYSSKHPLGPDLSTGGLDALTVEDWRLSSLAYTRP